MLGLHNWCTTFETRGVPCSKLSPFQCLFLAICDGLLPHYKSTGLHGSIHGAWEGPGLLNLGTAIPHSITNRCAATVISTWCVMGQRGGCKPGCCVEVVF